MKKHLFLKSLLVAIGLLVTSLTTPIWAWTAIYLNGNFTANNWDQATKHINYSLSDGHYFYPFYNSTTGDKYWRLYAQKDYKNYQLSPSSNNYTQDIGTVGYKVTCYESWKDYNFKTTNAGIGVISVHINQKDNGDLTPGVWLERPTIYIWHNWSGTTSNWGDNGGSGQKGMHDNNDGTYYYDGVYSASGTNVGIEGSKAIKKYFADNAMTKVGDPISGDKCRFTWNSSGYEGYDDETDHRGSLTITKIWTVTYNENGKTSGSAPAATDAVHGVASTLATNSGSLGKSHYVFTGWNTRADGKGTHYDAGANITTTTNVELFAEWQPVWAIKGSGTALGNWETYNGLTYNSTSGKYEWSTTLAANTTYQFKVCDRGNSDRLYGYGTAADYDLAFIGTTATGNVYYNSGSDHNVRLMTAGAGTYTFKYAWNSDHGELQVIFPTVTHPSTDYVYFKDTEGWYSAKGGILVELSGGTTTGGNSLPDAGSCTFAGVTYYYTSLGDNSSVTFRSKNDGTATTGAKSATSNKGKFYEYSSSSWKAFTVSVTLDNQGADIATGAASVTATYGSAMPSIASSLPQKTGYTFDGYYDNSATPVKYINSDGTSAHAWDKTAASPTLYAHWSQIHVTGVELDITSKNLYKGETQVLTATVSPSTALVNTVTWESSDEDVATVDNGTVTAVAPGTAIITVTTTDGSHTATCAVTVGYKLTYNANGASSGTVPTDATYYDDDDDATVAGNTGTLAKTGYTFRCWNTQENGLGTDYSSGDTYTMTDNTTLYAKWTDDDYAGKYTFHYGTSTGGGVNDFAGTWTVVAFPDEPSRTMGTIEDYTNYYDLTGFTIPDPSTAPHYFIGYEGWPKTQLGDHSATPSKVRAWSAKYSENNGYMNVKPGSIVISDGDTKTAVGAVGTLTIENSNRTGGENLNIGFSPNGYVLTIRNSSEVQTRTLSFTKVAGTDEIWETEILNDGLTAAEVAGTFKVGLATASGATDCFQSEWAAASVLNANKDEFVGVADDNVDYYPDLAADVKGRFQLVRVYKGSNTLRNKQNFALRYVTMKNWTIDNVLEWHQPGKWSLGHRPTIDEDVVVYHSTTVSTNDAVAKRVRIHKDDGYHTLTIGPTGGLLIAEDIKAYHADAASKDGDGYSATTRNDLLIRTDYSGNGSLICGSASDNTAVSYYFYSKAYKMGSWFVNQYIGIPFETCNAYDYYGMNIYEYDATKDSWKTPESSTLQSFTCYNMINRYNGGAESYYLDGVLNLPGKASGTQELICGWRAADAGSIDTEDGHQDYMFANSWTAPISVEALKAGDCSGTSGADLVHTIYIFNAGYVDPEESQKTLGEYAGTWSSIPFESASYMSNAVIPATQAFLVTSTKGSAGATLTLDYNKHVYTPASTAKSINTNPTRAPKRVTKGEDPTVLRIIVRSDSAIADNLYLLERGDFKQEFDNGWDGTKVFGEAFAPQIYAIHGDTKNAVDAIPDMEGTLLGFKAGTSASDYSFSFEYNDEEPLYLYDKDTEVLTQIDNEATYSFMTSDTKEHERFVITRKAPQIVTGFEEVEGENVKRAEKFIQDNMIFIRRGDRIYTATGNVVK